MSLIRLGFWAASGAGGSATFWISVYGGASADVGNGVDTDSGNNVYSVGTTESVGAGGDDLYLLKQDGNGVSVFQKTLGNARSQLGSAIATDSAGNSYVCGRDNDAVTGNGWLVAKYDSSGSVSWQKRISGASGGSATAASVNSNDEVYLGGGYMGGGAGQSEFAFAKLTSSGALTWQRLLGRENNDNLYGIFADNTDLYVSGVSRDPSPFVDAALLAKYDMTGTIVWQRQLIDSGGQDTLFYGIKKDLDDNVYAAGFTRSSPGLGGLLVKYNSSGTLQWQRKIGSGFYGLDVDSDNNIYCAGGNGSSGFIVKYNSSGTLQWQRTMTNVSRFSSIKAKESGAIHLTGVTSFDSNDLITLRLPSDGSLTGTYTVDSQTIVYAASSFTETTPTLTASTSSLSVGSPTYSDSTTTLTNSTVSLTSETLTIP